MQGAFQLSEIELALVKVSKRAVSLARADIGADADPVFGDGDRSASEQPPLLVLMSMPTHTESWVVRIYIHVDGSAAPVTSAASAS
jgi:hypothetical protein